jgi:hypothetical protein
MHPIEHSVQLLKSSKYPFLQVQKGSSLRGELQVRHSVEL